MSTDRNKEGIEQPPLRRGPTAMDAPRPPLGIHQRGVQSEGGAVDGGGIM